MFRLNRITRENYRDALTLTTDSEGKLLLQEEWLPSLAYSLVQSQFEKEWDVALIECEQLPIGYVMYGKWPEKDRYVLRRFAIDRRYQNRGVGQKVMPLIISRIQALYDVEDVYALVDRDNARAVHILKKFGFEDTCEVIAGEDVYLLKGHF